MLPVSDPAEEDESFLGDLFTDEQLGAGVFHHSACFDDCSVNTVCCEFGRAVLQRLEFLGLWTLWETAVVPRFTEQGVFLLTASVHVFWAVCHLAVGGSLVEHGTSACTLGACPVGATVDPPDTLAVLACDLANSEHGQPGSLGVVGAHLEVVQHVFHRSHVVGHVERCGCKPVVELLCGLDIELEAFADIHVTLLGEPLFEGDGEVLELFHLPRDEDIGAELADDTGFHVKDGHFGLFEFRKDRCIHRKHGYAVYAPWEGVCETWKL